MMQIYLYNYYMLHKIIYLYFINYINSIICYTIYYICIIRNEVITIKTYTIMVTKKIDEKKTLKYAVAFYFCTSGKVNFMLGKKMYQHINTVYDQREDGRGFNTCEVVYNYKAQKYEVLNVDTEIGNKEIAIL
jgi:hypothetical protein|nr:MAG TPA: hypothetical protein [Caudoviricetes sp.]